jgi:hypothetical protein
MDVILIRNWEANISITVIRSLLQFESKESVALPASAFSVLSLSSCHVFLQLHPEQPDQRKKIPSFPLTKSQNMCISLQIIQAYQD